MIDHLWCNGFIMTVTVSYLYTIIITLFALTPAVRIEGGVADIEVLGIQSILHKPERFAESLEVHDLALS